MTREEALKKAINIVAYYEAHFAKSKEAREDAANIIEVLEQEQEQKWIPVSERLPEEDGQYLITVKYKPEADYENIYAEHGEWIDGRWDMFCFGHCGEVEGIIAWMPLPEPYKAERSGEACGTSSLPSSYTLSS